MKQKEIRKYRAWDKDSKRMLEVSSISFKINGEIDVMVFGTKEDDDKRIKSGGSISSGGFVYGTLEIQLCDFILMQYTGLKDKSGKEIYKGDIVKYKMPVPLYQNKTFRDEISVVIWDKNTASIKTTKSNNITKSHEVIGNIYENKELLKGDKIND